MSRCLGVLVLALALTACAGSRSAAQHSPFFAVQTSAPAMRWVDTHGIAVSVPTSWRLGQGMCGTPKADTVLWNEDGILLCETNQPPGLSVVVFSSVTREPPSWYRQHTTPVTIDGISGRRMDAGIVSGSHEVQLDFPDRNLSVAVLSPDPSLLNQILSSVRVIRMDLNGCPTHPGGAYRRGSKPQASQQLVPAGATRLVGCSYQGRWLDHSNVVGPRAARHLARALAAAPYGFSRAPHHILPSLCGSTWRGSSMTARFEYAGRRPVTVTGHVIGCSRLGASNGRWGVRMRPWWVGLFTGDARYSGALIDPHDVS